MAGRRSDPYQYHARITDRLFAPSKLRISTHLRNIPLKPRKRASEQFQLESRISAGQDDKSILTHSKAKNHDQKFCSPDLCHGGDWGHTHASAMGVTGDILMRRECRRAVIVVRRHQLSQTLIFKTSIPLLPSPWDHGACTSKEQPPTR